MPCGCRGTKDSPKVITAAAPARPPQRPVIRRKPYTSLHGTQRVSRSTEE